MRNKTTTVKVKMVLILFGLLIFINCKSSLHERHIFYIHGRIIEIQGRNAFSEEFKSYEFDSIVSGIRIDNSIIHAELRTENVDPVEYATQVSGTIDRLLEDGVMSINITVVGASKGAIIAANISNLNLSPINYILLAGNNNYQEENNHWKFHGQVLCIYDLSDRIAGKNYDYWKNGQNFTRKFEQLEIETNLGHGFLYTPLNAWIEPSKQWIKYQNLR